MFRLNPLPNPQSAANVRSGGLLKSHDVASPTMMLAVVALAAGILVLPAKANESPHAQACATDRAAASPVTRPEPQRQSSDERTRKINLADLDLSTEAGLRSARERIHQVARNLCTQVESPLDLSHQTNFVACVESAMDSASRQLTHPAPAVARSSEPLRGGQP